MTATTTERPQTDEVSYFYLLRIQWQHPSGALAASVVHGVVPVSPGMSRHKLFTMLRDQAIARTGAPGTADITSFELAPDTL
jgi:hypothetical protein